MTGKKDRPYDVSLFSWHHMGTFTETLYSVADQVM